jgi:hypothetical protein
MTEKQEQDLLKGGFRFVASATGKSGNHEGVRGDWVKSGRFLGQTGASAPTPSYASGTISETDVQTAINNYMTNPAGREGYGDALRTSQQAGQDALDSNRQLREYAQTLSSIGREGALASGAFGTFFMPFAQMYESLMDKLPPALKAQAAQFRFDPATMTEREVAAKIQGGLAMLKANNLGERHVASIERAAGAIPNPSQRYDTSTKLAGDMLADDQRTLDRARYMRDFRDAVMRSGAIGSDQFDPSVAEAAFEKQAATIDYDREAQVLTNIMRNKDQFKQITQAIQLAHGAVRDELLMLIDAEFHSPGISRYFVGAL